MIKYSYHKYWSAYLIFIIIISCYTAVGQQLANSRKSSYFTYIYSISSDEAREILQGKQYQFPPIKYYHSLIDSFPTDSAFNNNLKNGHYLSLKALENKLHTEIFSVVSFDVSVMNNDRDVVLFVHRKGENQAIKNASVKINRKRIPYNPNTGNYELPKSTKRGYLTVEVGKEIAYFRLRDEYSYGNYYDGGYWNDGYRSKKDKYKGYLAFSKPKYLPNDTLKWKAFVTNRRGKPYTKPVLLTIRKGYRYGEKVYEEEIENITEGAYLGELTIGDSLKLDYDYVVSLLNPRSKRVIMSNNFYLEDYQLNEAEYSVRLGQEEYHAGEPIDIYMQGLDANGLNIMDSRVDIKLTTQKIREVIGDTSFIPNELWSDQISLDQNGETKVVIPKEIFPYADISVRIEAIFNNSNNETHTLHNTFNYNGKKTRVDCYLDRDTLIANYKKNGENISANGRIIGISYNDTLFHREITFPFKINLNPTINKYEFIFDDEKKVFDIDDQNSLFSCYALRVKDSVYFSFVNPRNIDVVYNIYQKSNTLICQGRTKKLDTAIYADNKDSYFISCNYIWAGNAKKYNQSILLYKDRLLVDIDQPNRVYPGQEVDITIKVRDIDENPIENVNICAGAINGQFEDNELVDVPYLGRQPQNRSTLTDYYIEKLSYSANKKLNSTWVNKYGLDSIPYYRIIFPNDGIEALYDSNTVIFGTQFSPYVFEDNGVKKDVFLVYVDNKLRYYAGNDNSNTYSFLVRHGYHEVKLRTREKEITIDSVLFKHGQKLELSVCIDSVVENVKVTKLGARVTKEESRVLQSGMLDLKNNFRGASAYLKQKNNVVQFSRYQNRDYYSSWLYNVGPFDHDSIEFIGTNLFSTKFLFEPGYEYTVDKGLVKMVKVENYIVGTYFENNDKQSLGEILEPIEVKYNLKTPIWDRFLCRSNIRYTDSGMGTFEFDYTGDKHIGIVRMIKSNSVPLDTYYKGNDRIIHNLTPGNYSMLLVTEDLGFYSIDSILVQKDGRSFLRFGDDALKHENPLFDTEEFEILKSGKNNSVDYRYIDYGGKCAIKGIVYDKDTGEPIPFANVIVESNGQQIGGGTSDFDGNYLIKPLPMGKVDIKATFVGYKSSLIEGLYLNRGKLLYFDIGLQSSSETLDVVEIIDYKVPLISKDQTSSGSTVTSEEIRKMPNRSANVVATTVGGVFSSDGERGTVRGARSDATAVFIDGIRVSENNNYEDNEISNNHNNDHIAEQVLLGSNKIRSKFVDYAYWQPNLITDEKGEVSFTVTFPDNITSWKSYALAMGAKKKTGSAFKETLSFIDLMGQLSSPRFLIEDDSTNVVGKIVNYDEESKRVKEEFTINNKLHSRNDTLVGNSVISWFPVTPSSMDTMELTYKITGSNGFVDGEERKIPVFPKGVKETHGDFYTLSDDSTIHITSYSNDYILYAENDALMPLLDEIKKLEDYPYYCMEQSSSKLIGMLMEKRIQEALGKTFNKDGKIRSLIRRIKKGQKEDGSWGWWSSSKPSIWMTSYVLKALYMAKESGYKVPDLEPGIDYLIWHLDLLDGNELIYALTTLSEINVEVSYKNYLRKLEKVDLTMYQYFQTIRIKQLSDVKYSIDTILSTVNTTLFGNLYWGKSRYGWYGSANNITLLAYKIIESKDSAHSFLPKISNYFLEIKGERRWYSTVDKSQIISTILPGILRTYDGDFKPVSITLSGARNKFITEFPYQVSISGNTDLTIEKTGVGNVYLTTYWNKWNPEPLAKDSLFSISTWFEKDGKKLDSLTAGVEVELKVMVKAKHKGDYVMIEVPIPAGCSYGDNNNMDSYVEVHREYFKHKTSIFCSYLNKGEYVFTIKLQPRYSGRYTLNPALAELMYLPLFYGRNEIKQTVIK